MRCLCGEKMSREEIKAEKRAGEKISEVTLCGTILFHQYFFISRYIRYAAIERMYLRIESGESGDFPVHEHSLVIVDREGAEHKLHIDRKEYGEQILRWVGERYPQIGVGKKKTEREQRKG